MEVNIDANRGNGLFLNILLFLGIFQHPAVMDVRGFSDEVFERITHIRAGNSSRT